MNNGIPIWNYDRLLLRSSPHTIIRRSLHGVLLSTETSGETTFNSYDAFARVAQTWRAAVSAATGTTGILPVAFYDYAPTGDLLATHTYTNATDYTTETYAYDMFGNRIATTDALGNTVYKSYDPFGHVVAEWGAAYPVRYDYDSQGRRVSLSTTRDGATWDTTTWTYDFRSGLCTSKTYADGSTVTNIYTPDKLPLRTTYASGKWKENVYDEQRRLCSVVYSSPDMDYELQFDVYGNATNVQDAAGNTWRYEYGSNSSLLGEEFITTGGTQFIASVATNSLIRTLDPFGRPSGYVFSVNGIAKGGMSYAYDGDGLVCGIVATNSSGRTLEVEYGNQNGYNYGHCITIDGDDSLPFNFQVSRDEYRRNLVTSTCACLQSTELDSRSYEYDALGRLAICMDTTSWFTPPSVYATYAYNSRSEVVSSAIGTNLFTHAYDEIGNHLLFGNNAATNTFTHNQVNQMVMCVLPGAPPTTLTYTPDGGLASDGTWVYEYDAEDQLASVTSATLTNGAIRVLNSYDYRHRRIGKTVERYVAGDWQATECRTFVYDDWNLIHETACTVNGGSTNVTEMQYFWGPDLSGTLQGAGGVGGLLAVSHNGQFYFPVCDHNGNVRKYVDEMGEIVAAYEYDDFGRTISQSGPLADFFRHRFSTKYYDVETGLYYYGVRFYHHIFMCWLNRDPIEEKGGENLYAFCKNNPVLYFDTVGTEVYATITLKRNHLKLISAIREDLTRQNSNEDTWGHWWIEFDDESYGWWPSNNVADIKTAIKGVPGDLNGQMSFGGTATKDPHHGEKAEQEFHPQRQNTGTMKYGRAKGKKCNCTKEDEAKDCIRSFAKSYSGEWRWPNKTCQTFQLEGMSNCCLAR